MSLREKMRKVFRRDSSKRKSKDSGTGIKIEYYKRGEVPPSKFRGPFDKEHQRRLAAWSFQEAQADRPRSLDLSLSPCTTLPDYLRPQEEAPDVAPDMVPPDVSGLDLSDGDSPASYHDEFIRDPQGNTGSLSSTTAVEPESFSDSTMTLFLEEEETVVNVKESIRYSSPILQTVTPPLIPAKGTPMPFPPEDLIRALNSVQIYS